MGHSLKLQMFIHFDGFQLQGKTGLCQKAIAAGLILLSIIFKSSSFFSTFTPCVELVNGLYKPSDLWRHARNSCNDTLVSS